MSLILQKLKRLSNKNNQQFYSNANTINLSESLLNYSLKSKDKFFKNLSEIKKDFLLNKNPNKKISLNINQILNPIEKESDISHLYSKMEEKEKERNNSKKLNNFYIQTEQIKQSLINQNKSPIKDDNKDYYKSSVLNKLKNEFHLDWSNRNYSKNFFSSAKREKKKQRIKNLNIDYYNKKKEKQYDKFVNNCLETLKNTKLNNNKNNYNNSIEHIKQLQKKLESFMRNKSDPYLDKIDLLFHIQNNNKKYYDNRDFNKFKNGFKYKSNLL